MKIMQRLWLEKFVQARLALMEAAGALQHRLVASKPQGMEESMAWQACMNAWKLKQLLVVRLIQ
jgi:hypothetical protein